MTEGQELWLVLAALHLLECLEWSGARTYLFRSGWWRGWKLNRPSRQGGKGVPRLAYPLPPMGWAFVSEGWPFSMAPEGVSPVAVAAPNPGRRAKMAPSGTVPWSEAGTLPFPAKASPAFLEAWKRTVDSVASAEPDDRAGAIGTAVDRFFDVSGARERLALFNERSRSLRIFGNILFFWWLAIVPLAAMRFGFGDRAGWGLQTLLMLAVLGLLIQGVSALNFFRVHRRTAPGETLERWQHAILVALVPTHAIRAAQSIARDCLADFHPLAVAFATLPRERALDFAGSVWRDAVHPVAIEQAADSARAAAWFHENAYLPAVRALLERENVAPATLLHGPADAPAWCPRCLAPFQSAQGTCPDCDGVALIDGNRPPPPPPAASSAERPAAIAKKPPHQGNSL